MKDFGNRTGAAVTKGSAPSSSMVYDAATNRIVGGNYDANGNMVYAQGATLSYDVDNRVASATVSGATEYYAYAPDQQADLEGEGEWDRGAVLLRDQRAEAGDV